MLRHTDHPGKCVLPDTGEVRSLGERWEANYGCFMFECRKVRIPRLGHVIGLEEIR